MSGQMIHLSAARREGTLRGRAMQPHPMSAPASPAARAAVCTLCGGGETVRLFVKVGWTFVRCTGCGLVALRPAPTAAQLAAHHEASYRAGRYAVFAAAETVRTAVARYRLANLRSLAPAGPWLDVGCSTGALLAELADDGIAAEGLELSAAAVAQARARGFVVHEGTVERFVPSRRYAVVSAFDLIEHLLDPAAFARHVRGWLLPGGVFVLTLPNATSVAARLMGRRWYFHAPPDHVHGFTPETIRRLLETTGWAAVTVRAVRKPLTADYVVEQLAHSNPALARIARATTAIVPRRWRARPWSLPLGEMLVTARPAGS